MGRKKDPIVDSFAAIAKKTFSPCRIFLFGSRARNTARKASDYDFLLVSPKFKKMEWERRSAKAYKLKRNIPAAMDIICLTPKEFEEKKKQTGIIQEAVKDGIEV